MPRITRYQGAIIRDDHILLIKHKHREDGDEREYWVIPGGGREADETEEECVKREMQEETHLEVRVERVLLDEPGHPGDVYQRFKTYLCIPVAGEVQPDYEPEFNPSEGYAIVAVRWFNLQDETTWGREVLSDPFTYPLLQQIAAADT